MNYICNLVCPDLYQIYFDPQHKSLIAACQVKGLFWDPYIFINGIEALIALCFTALVGTAPWPQLRAL